MHTFPTRPQLASATSDRAAGSISAPSPSFSSLLTVSEVADYLRVSEMTVYRLITNRDISATKVGRVWRISSDDLATYLHGQRVPHAS